MNKYTHRVGRLLYKCYIGYRAHAKYALRILRSLRMASRLHLSEYKTRNISETVEDRAKVTINSLYKIVCLLSIAAKMYDLE